MDFTGWSRWLWSLGWIFSLVLSMYSDFRTVYISALAALTVVIVFDILSSGNHGEDEDNL